MLRNRLYYSVKPLLPWPVRMSVRRWFARRKLRRVADVWPIKPGSEQPPAGWRGEKGFVNEELLRRHIPREKRYEYFICGPRPMMDTVERSLHRLGVPLGDFHSERFNLV